MFNPSKQQVRNFFTAAWQKHRGNMALTPLETMAVELIKIHPEYHADLEDPNAADLEYPVEGGRTNPFLHLSMHLAIQEQLSIDHPPGIRAAWLQLRKHTEEHAAAHIVMEALGEVVWEAQRLGQPFNNERYLELIQKHTTKDT